MLPMFALGSVLLPGDVLPLHVFEPRYRALIRACLAAEVPEFGVVLIERGSEVGGGDHRRAVGTAAQLVQLAEIDDGRYAAIAVGTRRLRVSAWLPDDPYPLADTDEWPDTDDDPLDTAALALSLEDRVRAAAALAAELGDEVGNPVDPVSPDPLMASYQLVSMAPVGAADRYDLLCQPGPLARLERLQFLLSDVEAVLQFRLAGG